MESFPGKSRAAETPKRLEESANFEGVDSILTCERASHPVIQEQIVELLFAQEVAEKERIDSTKWVPLNPEWIAEHGETDQDVMGTEDSDDIIVRGQLHAVEPDKDRIRRELSERVAHVSTVTEISFEEGEPDSEMMRFNWNIGDQKASAKQLAITLAHEKGHRIRPYVGSFLNQHFAAGFDPSKARYTDQEYAFYRNEWAKDLGGTALSDERIESELKEYLFSAMELAERMNQLKCYFGMRGAEKFTHEHLAYAREHYVEDTGLDNEMTRFFQAITPETEAAFLDLINTAGI